MPGTVLEAGNSASNETDNPFFFFSKIEPGQDGCRKISEDTMQSPGKEMIETWRWR